MGSTWSPLTTPLDRGREKKGREGGVGGGGGGVIQRFKQQAYVFIYMSAYVYKLYRGLSRGKDLFV